MKIKNDFKTKDLAKLTVDLALVGVLANVVKK